MNFNLANNNMVFGSFAPLPKKRQQNAPIKSEDLTKINTELSFNSLQCMETRNRDSTE